MNRSFPFFRLPTQLTVHGERQQVTTGSRVTGGVSRITGKPAALEM